MAVYNIDGNVIKSETNNCVAISDIKTAHPTYTDDQLLDEAILVAKTLGKSAIILWDGNDIHFSGSITHVCKGFGGIDFNGSKIYMPNYDKGIILSVEPDTTSNMTISASVILKDYTTEDSLKNKIFTMNNGGKSAGNADMCLGDRTRDSDSPSVNYWSPTIITDPDGRYKTGELFLTPNSGEVTCYNVHDFPNVTFELCNGIIISHSGQLMTNFMLCTRSNVCIHGFTLEGMNSITQYHDGIFYFNQCCNIEVYNIFGASPFPSKVSGYVLYFRSVTSLYVHDVFSGDSTRWGAVGSHYLHNSVFERCSLNRWDCHFAQTGFNVIRECVLGRILYGVGKGKIIFENCIIKNDFDSEWLIILRGDCVGVFDGDITVRKCEFYTAKTSTNSRGIWTDACDHQKPTNSALTGSPSCRRIIENCIIHDGCNILFKTGTSYDVDKSMFNNFIVNVKNMDIDADDSIIFAPSEQAIKEVTLDGCNINGNTINNLICDLRVINSILESITCNVTIPNLIATGNIFTGVQAITTFTKYSMSGNISADMESVNKHSS